MRQNMKIKDKVVVCLGDTCSFPLHLTLKSVSNIMGIPLRNVSLNTLCNKENNTLDM